MVPVRDCADQVVWHAAPRAIHALGHTAGTGTSLERRSPAMYIGGGVVALIVIVLLLMYVF